MNESLTLGEKVRFLRERKNLKQKELAEILKIAQQTLSHYEKGRLIPDIETCKKIASYFDVSLDELLDNVDKKQATLSREIQLETQPYPSNPREIIAPHREGDQFADLPPEAIAEIQMHIDYVRHKYKKQQPADKK